MNERGVGGNGFVPCPVAAATHQMKPWSRAIAAILIMTVMGLTMLPAGVTFAQDQTSSSDDSDSTGIQVASWLLTIPYCAGKSAFAVAGSVVGSLGYAFSGGNSETAQAIWTKSVYGTYILRPAHLRGEEPIHFVGQADEHKSESVKRAAASSNHADK
ncbi:MAG TPA: hypothetical protein VLL06_07345 [Nitrospiraceae bacterium]|nr:hypothetical protein [Nitrospiraceae bacterium]